MYRPSAIPPMAHGVQSSQAFSGLVVGRQAAGQASVGASGGSGVMTPVSTACRPPAIRSSPAAEPRDLGVDVVPSVSCRPPAIHSSPEAEPWDPFVGDEYGDPGLDEGALHVFGRTSEWCEFCGLPFLCTGREAVSHLAGDGTAAHEVGPRAAGIAVCECGGGWA